MIPADNQNWPFVVNLCNSIIGVAVLAMPFCFKQCGIILGMLVIMFCTWLTLASCQLLVKAGIVSHHRSYEFLAYHTYGAAGKFLVEIGMIGMQLGTLIAQIVVIGDLGPPIVSHLLGVENNSLTRTYLILFLCLFVGLPIGLLKDLHNISRFSTICVMFYASFICYVFWLSSGNLWSGEWYSHVQLWRPKGLFQCLPIMSFSFGCQTQLFILYDALPEPSLHAIKSIIHSAVTLCGVAYVVVGFFGYITFYHVDIPGDVITVFPAAMGTVVCKLGFVMSIAITFPVIIFPCRASIYTLLFQKKSKHSDDVTSTYIPEFLFKSITVTIVVGSMITGILIPNVEFILGLSGAITGTLVCYIFPALFFLRVMSSKAEGKRIAQMVLVFGASILLISTATTLLAQDKGHVHETVQKAVDKIKPAEPIAQLAETQKMEKVDQAPLQKAVAGDVGGERRVEPPNPDAPGADKKVPDADKPKPKAAEKDDHVKEGDGKERKKDDEGGGAGGGKEKAKETGEEQEKRKEELLDALENQRKEQEKLLQEQKALLKELKDHKEQEHPPPEQKVAQQQGQVQGQEQGQVRQQGQGQQQGVLQQNAGIQQGLNLNAGQQQPQVPQGALQQGAGVQPHQVMQPVNQGVNLLPSNSNAGSQLGVAQNSAGMKNQAVPFQNSVLNKPQKVHVHLSDAALNNQAQNVPVLNNAQPQNQAQNLPVLNNQVQNQAQDLPVVNNMVQNQAQNLPVVNNQMQNQAQNLPVVNNQMQNQAQNLPVVNNLAQNQAQNLPMVNNQIQNQAQNLPVVNNLQGQNNQDLNNQPVNKQAEPALLNQANSNIQQFDQNPPALHQPAEQPLKNLLNNPVQPDQQKPLDAMEAVEPGLAQGVEARVPDQNAAGLKDAVDVEKLGDKELLRRKKRDASKKPQVPKQQSVVSMKVAASMPGKESVAEQLVAVSKNAENEKEAGRDVDVAKMMENEVEFVNVADHKAEVVEEDKTDHKAEAKQVPKAQETVDRKEEMRRLKSTSGEEDLNKLIGSIHDGGDNLDADSFRNLKKHDVVLRSLKSKEQ